MSDIVSVDKRSEIMRAVKRCGTGPEMRVRRLLHLLGYRFRVQDRSLPGSPDIVFRGLKLALFVHGCFWHRHHGCKLASMPASNVDFWKKKFESNILRDNRVREELLAQGWDYMIIWECETHDCDILGRIILDKMNLNKPTLL